MTDDDETLNQQIKKSLNEAVDLGLVEVVGINSQGDWLYQATPLCRDLMDQDKSWDEIIESIGRLKHPE